MTCLSFTKTGVCKLWSGLLDQEFWNTGIAIYRVIKATPSHTLVSGHSQAKKWMWAGG